MKSIGIAGSGIAGLHLGLFLQSQGVNATIYSDRSPDEIRAGRLFSVVVRFEPTLERERALGVHHWDYPDFGVFGVRMNINGPLPLVWTGLLKRPASGVDMRVYTATLLEDFAARGGKVVVGALQAPDVERFSADHDLMVVASGRGSLTEMFPRDPERSPYEAPQRRLTGGFFRGLRLPESLAVTYAISPGHGEIFQAPFTSFEDRLCSILIEAIPGQGLDVISEMRYDDDPTKFNATVLELLREHAPSIFQYVEPEEFGVRRPLDVIQGAITPTVRRGYARLGNGRFAMALGDVHIVNDPVIAQGANTASRCATVLSDALAKASAINEAFCRETEQKLWEAARSATEWTNATLQPPPPHVIELFMAAGGNKELANELVENFGSPDINWKIFGSPEGAAKFLAGHAGG